MKVIDYRTKEIIKEVTTVNEGISSILSLEKEAEIYGWAKPNLDIVDDNGNSVL